MPQLVRQLEYVPAVERSPLDELLRRDVSPRHATIKCPDLPSRLWVVDWMWQWRHVPDPTLDIEWGTIYYRETVPTTGKCYAGCAFIDCDIEPPTGRYEVVGCYLEDSPRMHAGFGKYGYGDLIGNLIKYPD
jgi:hypothetical protein